MKFAQLIHQFIDMETAAARQLEQEFGEQDVLAAWHAHRVPQHGTLSDGTEYSFHGIGCWTKRTDGIEVDFDFGADLRTDGFDAWRLWLFAEQFPAQFPEYQRWEQVNAELQVWIQQGKVFRSDEPHDHLWYLLPDRSELA